MIKAILAKTYVKEGEEPLVFLGRAGGIGACRIRRGMSLGLSGPLRLPSQVSGSARVISESNKLSGPTEPCTREPSRGLQGAEFEPKSEANRAIGSRICDSLRVDDSRNSSISCRFQFRKLSKHEELIYEDEAPPRFLRAIFLVI